MQPWNNQSGEPNWFDTTRNVRRTSSNVYAIKKTETPSPATEPVTLAQAKTQCRVDFTEDDDNITTLITMARRMIENECGIALVPKTVIVTLDLIVDIELPLGPNPTSIVLADNLGNIIDSSAYTILPGDYQRIDPRGFWYFGATLSYMTGYGAGEVDLDLQLGILQQIAFLYENKGDATDTRKGVNPGVAEIARVSIEPYKRYTWL